MTKQIILCLLIVFLTVTLAHAKKKEIRGKEDAKVLSGMSIVGNDEAPKALYIVPWKSSEISGETDLNMPVNMGYSPVDLEEFRRKLDYYYVSTTNNTGR